MNYCAGSLDYAHARLSARHGQRADASAWRRLEHVREFPAFLDAVRASPLAVWVAGTGPSGTPHEIDLSMRNRWRAVVAEVARWMPAEWQPAVAWCAVVVDLQVLQHLARGGAAMPWMRDDATLRDFCERDGGHARDASSLFGPLAAGADDADRIGDAWLAEFQRRIPRGGEACALLDELQCVLKAHLVAFRDRALRDGWPLRRTLEARLAAMFRRAIADPAEAFIFLALTALDLERLRGELLRRVAFAGVPIVIESAA